MKTTKITRYKWEDSWGIQNGKKIKTKVARIKGKNDQRFVLYPVMEKINMWGLWDTKTDTQHYIMKEDADTRVSEVVNDLKVGSLRKSK